ncbi:amino acid ABC transporter permease [Arthrobacter sp. StoSoilB5]|uniref:amino acid ABC transporter permease n=1 Tax=Arthrobacter sp. StoSoilB5 TaxID=2830992 RepID=UPI001CC632D3|nr:amino acid ABC transporter permease [Arthrobacter sp. StoSoilB5]BCW44734.1 polar amino acid ABC transporter permease [Arthrobacter sp. StoSoilB5]
MGLTNLSVQTSVTYEVRKLRHPMRTLAALIVGVLAALLAWSFATNPNLDWSTVSAYLFAELTMRGLLVTLYLTAVSMIIGLVGGTLIALMALSDNWVLRAVATGFVGIFRGVPVLVQIIFWGFIGAFFPVVSIGIPFSDIVFYSAPTSSLVSATTAAILALGLNEAAYASEIVRGGIQSVDSGQREACAALGMNPVTTLRRVVLPQAMRVIIPPMGNEVITLLKTSALVSVIAGNDLMTNLQQVYAQNYKVIPLLVVASFWYLVLTFVLTIIQRRLEVRFGRGSRPAIHPTGKKAAK